LGDNRQPTAGDLFCGAGGFSEGFRQAGFSIRWGVDNWEPAVNTFSNNFPEAKVFKDDILSFDFQKLESVDVLIGSPPCTHFSLANKGGNGDITRGLKLVSRFMDAVEALRPRYHIMENVPPLHQIFERKLPRSFRERVDKCFPHRLILNSADFGVPQSRRRLFSGNFPEPQKIGNTQVPMRRIIYGLPYPVQARRPQTAVCDSLYGFTIPSLKLTNHFMDTSLDNDSVKECKRMKKRHPWYGPMRFPDALELPSRTIDTNTGATARQGIVILDSRKKPPIYRALTLRERASLQGFPITYQFCAGFLGQRSSLVGNAVAPPVARALGLAIRRDMALPLEFDATFKLPETLPPDVISRFRLVHRFPLKRTYRCFIPGTKPFARVDFDNRGVRPAVHPAGESTHLVEWQPLLYLGYARDYASFKLNLGIACRIAVYTSLSTGRSPQLIKEVVSASSRLFAETVPDASTLQAIWSGRMKGFVNPDWIVNRTAHICREIVGKPKRTEIGVRAGEFAPLLIGTKLAGGKDAIHRRWKHTTINLYTACAAVTLAVAALLANSGVIWLKHNWGKHYSKPPLSLPGSIPDSLAGVLPAEIMSMLSAARKSLPPTTEPLVLAPIRS
jgi:DNA-cytosine methyltransferase